MNTENDNKLQCCEIKKGQLVQVLVKEYCSHLPQLGGNLLWETTSKGFASMHAILKTIYNALPEYKGKRIFVEVRNKTTNTITRNTHFVHRNKIPLSL